MSDPVIRVLTPDDLGGALALSSTAGWNQRLADWRMLLALAPGGSFAAISDSRIVGTAVAIDYDSFAWIAMMLVDPASRGRGLGRRLLEAAMASVRGDLPMRLDATPKGRPLYQQYGFEDEVTLTRHVADVSRVRDVSSARPNDASPRVIPLTAAHLPAVAEQDVRIFGGNRRAVLDWVLEDAPPYARVVQREGGPVHYCVGRHGRLFDQIGPVVAGDDEIARALVMAALSGAEEGARVAIDSFDSRGEFTTWLRACGFRVERPFFRMRRPGGGRASSSHDRRVPELAELAILGPEFG